MPWKNWRVSNRLRYPKRLQSNLPLSFQRHKRVGWTTDPNAENAMRQDMDDYLFDHIKGARGLYGLSVEAMDSLMDAAIAIAKRQAAR